MKLKNEVAKWIWVINVSLTIALLCMASAKCQANDGGYTLDIIETATRMYVGYVIEKKWQSASEAIRPYSENFVASKSVKQIPKKIDNFWLVDMYKNRHIDTLKLVYILGYTVPRNQHLLGIFFECHSLNNGWVINDITIEKYYKTDAVEEMIKKISVE